nr:universal stress protein PHOS34 [Tanacetum cinerariifolium]
MVSDLLAERSLNPPPHRLKPCKALPFREGGMTTSRLSKSPTTKLPIVAWMLVVSCYLAVYKKTKTETGQHRLLTLTGSGYGITGVDGSEESMKALNWALDNVKLRSEDGSFFIIHVQSPPSIAAGLNPGAIPFGGPSEVEVPAFTQAIQAHQRKITDAIITHSLEICANKNVIASSLFVDCHL